MLEWLRYVGDQPTIIVLECRALKPLGGIEQMKRFVALSLVFMGWAFYEYSGGSDFDPAAARQNAVEARLAKMGAEPPLNTAADSRPTEDTVTRVSLNLATLSDILGEERPEPVNADTGPILPADEMVDPVENAQVLPSIIFPGSTIAAAKLTQTTTDVRIVNADNANVRGGPGTNFGVVSQLSSGAQVEVLDEPGNGWVQMRPVDGGPAGWIADFLLNRS